MKVIIAFNMVFGNFLFKSRILYAIFGLQVMNMRKMFIVLVFTLLFVCGCVDDTSVNVDDVKTTKVTTTSQVSTTTTELPTTTMQPETTTETVTTDVVTTTATTTTSSTTTSSTTKTSTSKTTKKTSTTSKTTKSTTKKTTTKATTTKKVVNQGRTIYITSTGKKYHYNSHCNGGHYYESTLEEAKRRGLTPCKKCVG